MKDNLKFNTTYLRANIDTWYPDKSPEEGKCNNYNLCNNVRNPDIVDKNFKGQQSIPSLPHSDDEHWK